MYRVYNKTQLTLPIETSVLIPTQMIFTACTGLILFGDELIMNL